jgi:hypothetical protein
MLTRKYMNFLSFAVLISKSRIAKGKLDVG